LDDVGGDGGDDDGRVCVVYGFGRHCVRVKQERGEEYERGILDFGKLHSVGGWLGWEKGCIYDGIVQDTRHRS